MHTIFRSLLFALPFFLLSCGGNNDTDNDEENGGREREQAKSEKKQERERSHGIEKLLSFGIDTSKRIPKGLKVGDRAPAFEAVDAEGARVSQKELLAEGPLLLFFYRGQWCPICSKTLSKYADSLQLLRERGITPLAVTPETTPNVESMREKSGTEVRVIPDTSRRIMKEYKVLFKVTEDYQEKIRTKLGNDIASNNAAEEAYLPVPASYLIDREGTVVWRHFDPDYKQRASVQAVLRASKELEGSDDGP